MNDLENFIKQLETNFPNPFLNKNFEIIGAETYSKGSEIHKIGPIKLIYKNKILRIKFRLKDTILAIFIYIIIINDPFGYIEKEPIFLNNKKVTKCGDDIKDFSEIFKKIDNLEINEIKIDFSGEWTNLFDYHKQCSIHIFDKSHSDNPPEIWNIIESDNEDI